jgi:hypothetical protein
MFRKAAVTLFILSMTAALSAGQSPTRSASDDGQAEPSITGTIKAVVTFQDAAGTVGVHLDLQTAEGLVSVHISPAMFMGENNFSFFADDQVEVIGRRTVHDGNSAIWATAVRKGRSLLVLRNADGTPKWAPPTEGADGCGVNHPVLPVGTER